MGARRRAFAQGGLSKPREILEIITHLAFYSGWENAMSAVAVAKVVFAHRKIGADQLRRGLGVVGGNAEGSQKLTYVVVRILGQHVVLSDLRIARLCRVGEVV